MTLTARPVFNTDERRVYRLLREALPHHIVLSKLPLVRFCQPNDPNDVRYWYDLLGSNHVGLRVLASYAEDQIITSDPRQLLEIEKAKQEWAQIGK